MTIDEAARLLGISREAVRKRIKRGTLKAKKDKNGRWAVEVPDDIPDTGQDDIPDTSTKLVQALQDEINYLREESRRKDQLIYQKDQIIYSLAEKIPRLQEPEEKEPQRADPKEKPASWFDRIFKGGTR